MHTTACVQQASFYFALVLSLFSTKTEFKNDILQVTKPEKRIKCTLIPGDGVGPELVYSVQEVFKVNILYFVVLCLLFYKMNRM